MTTWLSLKSTRAGSASGSFVPLTGGTMTGALVINQGAITADATALSITSIYNNAGVTFGGAFDLNVTNTASAVGSFIARLRVGGTSVFSVTTAGVVVTQGSTSSSSFIVGSDSSVYGASQIRFSTDTFLLRDLAANVIGQRNGLNAQTFNIYNTFTSSTNHERLAVRWNSGVAWIDTQKGSGGGSAQPLVLGTDSIERVRLDINGNVVVNTAAIATNATNGFLYVPSCAGTPTGVPTSYTGRVPIVVDTTNNKLYFYSNSAWRDAGP